MGTFASWQTVAVVDFDPTARSPMSSEIMDKLAGWKINIDQLYITNRSNDVL